MDLLNTIEIYIPVDAEVKTIPLLSLPNSVLRRMGLPCSGPDSSLRPTDSPEGIWISPADIRRKGQKRPPHTGNSVIENMSSLLGQEIRAALGPLQMSFVSANRTAYNVLKNTMPEKNISTHTSRTNVLPQGSAPQTYKGAVVIYRDHIYLSAKKPEQSQREAHEPQLSSISSASEVSSKCQKMVTHWSPQASLEPADKEPKRKKMRVEGSPQTSTKQELLKEKHTLCKAVRSDNSSRSDVSSSTPAPSVPESSDGVDRQPHKEADGDQDAEPAWLQPHVQEETSNVVGVVEQSIHQSWSMSEFQHSACVSTSRREEFDFKQLAEEEKIEKLKAQLRQKEAALNSLYAAK